MLLDRSLGALGAFPHLAHMTFPVHPARSILRPLILATGIATLLSATAQAANVTLTKSDAINTTSFNTNLNWSDGAAPTAGNDYFTGAFVIRTPGTGGPYTFEGDSLSIDSGGILAFKVAPVITINNLILNGGELSNYDTGTDKVAKLAGTITVNAPSRINANTSPRQFRIDSLIQGAGDLTILGLGSGAGVTTFTNPGNTFTGGLTLNNFGVLAVETIANGGVASQLGAAPADAGKIVFNAGTLRINGAGGSTDRLFTLAANGVIDSSGTGAVTFTNTGEIAHTGTAARTLTLTGSNTDANTFAPVIGNVPGSTTNLTKNGTGTWVVTGSNTYSGSTTINTGILRISNAAALGTTGTVILGGGSSNNGVLELTGGINLAKNFTLNARQNAAANETHIRNLSGNNSITGTINLTINGSFYNIESASVGETLTINGNINGSGLTSGLRQPRFMGAGDGVLNGDLILPTGSGVMDLFKEGSGTWTLNGTAGHTGATMINGGSLVLGASAALIGTNRIHLGSGTTLNAAAAGGVTLNFGATLDGSGTVIGNVSNFATARIVPGTETETGTLTISGDLALNEGVTIAANFGNATTPGAGVNDLISVSNNLTTSGTTNIEFHPSGSALAGSYRLINYGGTGTLGGTFNVLNDTRYTVATDTATTGQVNLVVSGSAGNLVWSGTTMDWDVKTSSSWNNGTEVFYEADSVTFNDTAAATDVNLVGALLPGAVTVNTTATYTLGGTGKISGGTGLTKSGTGTLLLSSANDFHGEVTVSAGKLMVGNAAALGSTVSGTTVSAGATLDLNSFLLPAGEVVTISGAGVEGKGAVVNNGATGGAEVGLKKLVLAGNAAIGGTERWEIRDVQGGLDAAGHSLTKVGPNTIRLKDLGETHLGNVIVNGGTLEFEGNTTFGDGAGTVQVALLGTLSLYNSTLAGTKTVQLQEGTIGTVTGAGTANTLASPVNVQNSGMLNVATDTTLRLTGAVSGTGAMAIFGGGTAVLAGSDSNTFTGITQISQGTVQLNKTGGAVAISGDLVAAGGTIAVLAANQFAPDASVTIDQGGAWSNGSSHPQTLSDFTVNTTSLQTLNALNVTNVFSITKGTHDLNSGQSATAHALHISGDGNFRLGANGSDSTMNIGAGGLVLDDGTLQLGQTGGTVTALVNLGGDVTGSGTSAIFNPNTSGPRIVDLLGETRTFNITDGVTTVSPMIDNGGVTKTGDGTLVLSGASIYTGATTVNAGTLLVNGAISGSTVTVNTGGTLGGSGTIVGDVTVNGRLEPGSSLGSALGLAFSDLTLGSNSSTVFELSSPFSFDRVTDIDQFTLDGTVTISLFGGYVPVMGDTFDLIDFAAVNATAFNASTDLILPSLDPGLSWDDSKFVSEGVLTVVPEPSVALTLLGGLSLMGGMRRFRRR